MTKLFLVMAFVMGSSNAWGDDYTETLTFNNSTIPSGWTNGAADGMGSYNTFTTGDGYIVTTNTWNVYSLTSNSTSLTINYGQKIIITAKKKAGYTGSSQKLIVSYSTDSGKKFTDYSTITTAFTATEYTDYTIEIATNNMSSGCRLQIRAQAADIQKIEIKASPAVISELTFDEGNAPEDFSSLTIPTSIPTVTVKYTPQSGWNTICMPIQLKGSGSGDSYMTDIFGSDWKAFTLSSYSENVLTFAKRGNLQTIDANTPYLVYAPNGSGNLETLNLSDISVTYSANPNTPIDGATFKGTYAPIAAPGMAGKYGVTTEGKLGRGNSYASIKGYRAYIEIADPEARPTIVFKDDETTDLGFVKMIDPEAKNVYTLSGQKVEKAGKGIYIVNGRKVVIK